MAITSNDIQTQSFAIDRKGYMVDEVDDFLEHVANEIDILNETIANLQQKLEEKEDAQEDAFAGFDAPAQFDLEEDDAPQVSIATEAALSEKDAIIASLKAELAEAKADSNAIAQALIVAQRSADDIVAAAEARADQIIADAQAKGTGIIDEAEAERVRIEDAINTLEDERAEVRAAYQDVLKDFIADATNKLSALNKFERSSFAHARIAEPASQPVVSAQVALREEQPFDAAYATATAAQPVVAAATVSPAVMEKDFSGFGDTDDDFGFDDID